jgi:WhiB family transcriptional regulator, redox-sensing transcriptional regulator
MAALPQLSVNPSNSWQQHGLCRSVDAAVFFPPSTHFEHKPEREAREDRAKEICAECTVREQCLDYALAVREPHGVWGGTSEQERKQMLGGTFKAG